MKDEVQDTQNTTIADDDDGGKIEAQVGGAVDSFLQNQAKAEAEGDKPKTEEPEEPKTPKKEPKEPKAKVEVEEPEPPKQEPKTEIDESLLERAVRAGLSMKEARGFGSPDVLESVLGKLEAKKDAPPADGAQGNEPGGGEGGGEDEDMASQIPDLDPEEWDEKIVNAFKAVKNIVRKQDQTIRELRSAGESAKQDSWIDGKLGELDDSRRSALGIGEKNPTKEQTAAKERVLAKFKALEAGYKAMGVQVDRDELFNDAVTVAVGQSPAKPERKAAIEKRNAMAISRPSHDRVTPQGQHDDLDSIKDSVAGALSKFFD